MKNQITYTEHNGLYYPDLALPEQTSYPLGKYANLGRIKRVQQGRKQGVSEASLVERTETTMFSSGKKKCNAFRYLIPSPYPQEKVLKS